MGGKTMKKTMLTFTGILLFFAAVMVVAPAHAQTTAAKVAANSKPVEGYTLTPADFKVGDTIYLCQDSLHYLTGERMSKWVYAVPHVIRQLGGKTHPNGVLVAGINSWVYPATAMAVHPRYETQAEADAKAAEAAKADTLPAPAEEPAPVEPLPAEPAPADTVAAPAPAEEEPGVLPAEPVAEEPAPAEPAQKADSVKATHATAHHMWGPRNPREMTMQERYNNAKLGVIDRFSIGVRGGVASYVPDADYNWGFDAMFDIQYAHYWTLRPKQCRIGFLMGLSAGYMQSGIKTYLDYSYDTKDVYGNTVQYAVKGNVQETDRQWMLQVPVMFSLVAPNGFFLNVGPTFMLPVSTSYRQTVTDPSITYRLWDVDIPNENITGVLTDAQCHMSGANDYNRFKLNVLVGAELGYDFQFSTGNSLGLGVYFNYGAYSAYKPVSTASDSRAADVIHITTPQKDGQNAVVNVQPLMGTTNRIGYFDVGLKLAYHLNFWN